VAIAGAPDYGGLGLRTGAEGFVRWRNLALAAAVALGAAPAIVPQGADARASAWVLVRASGELGLTLDALPRTPCEGGSGADWVTKGSYKLSFTARRATNDSSNIIYKGFFGGPTGSQAMALDVRTEVTEQLRSATEETDPDTGASSCVVQDSSCTGSDARTVRGASKRVSVTPTPRLKPAVVTLDGLGAADFRSCAPLFPDPFELKALSGPREQDGAPIIRTRVPMRRWVPRRPRIRLAGQVPVRTFSGVAELTGTLSWRLSFTLKRIIRFEGCSEFGRRPGPFVCDSR
jgi:hypothetical protein